VSAVPHGRSADRIPTGQISAACLWQPGSAVGRWQYSLSIDRPSVPRGRTDYRLECRRCGLDCTAGGDPEHSLAAGRPTVCVLREL
jgi:hypothetical protein